MQKSFLFFIACFVFIFTARAQQWNGYFLVAATNSTSATLYDTSWATYHTWTGLGSSTGYSAYVMPGGDLWRGAKGGTTPTGAPGGPICGRITKHNYAGTLLWDFIYNDGSTYVTHHDIQPMPNGNVLVIAYEKKTSTEVAAAGCVTYTGTMWPDKIVEIQPTGTNTGTIVWEWHAWDHLMQDTNASLANYVSSMVNNPQLLNINKSATSDWLHMNGVDYNPMLDQITWSSHNLSEWFIIDHSTTTAEAAGHTGGKAGKGGDILYRWGNPQNYKAGTSSNKILNVTHDAHWADEFSSVPGRLCGFNNNGVSTSQSSADQIITPISGYNYTITSGSAYLPSTYTNRNTVAAANGTNMGSSQQLPNGNELVCYGVGGKIKEFNSSGSVIFAKSVSTGQCKKYSACWINNPAPVTPAITAVNNNLTSSSATSYQWYLNGQPITGATSQLFTTTQSGNYLVRTTDTNGCVYVYSSTYTHTQVPASVVDLNFADKINLYPNPTEGIVNIKNASLFGKEYSVQLIDLSGRLIQTYHNATSIDISFLANGHYVINLISPEGSVAKKIVLNK